VSFRSGFGDGIEKYVSAAMKRRILAGETPAWMLSHIRSRYIIMSTLSAPLWAHRRMFRTLRYQASFLTRCTGRFHSLDHIIPIDHPRVCGLTVPWNLRVVPHSVNAAKRNTWNPDQMDLDLDEPGSYQYRLDLPCVGARHPAE
jgi:hypothetical protein